MNNLVTILLIDDKAANLFALEQLLDKSGRTFIAAHTGKDGLKIALNQDVDLIILDVQMPEMDGFEVAQILKSNKRTRDIPIIFASAEKKERKSILQGFEEGAVDYLPKPLDAELTKAKVTVLLTIQLQKRELIEKNLALERADVEIKKLNASLQNNLEQLEVANKDLESFSHSISHDLRSPIRSMHGFAEMLQDDLGEKATPEIQRSLDRIKNSAAKMNAMIEDLLEFSRLGKRQLVKGAIPMDKVVGRVLDDLAPSVGTAVIDVQEILPAPADSALMTHVWTNIIANALKYSSKNASPRIEIGSEKIGDTIRYYVKDNGAGFDMRYADKLFGVFQRLHRQSDFEGTGVGLAIVHRILVRHGGKIWAEAKVDEGATFFFSLPVSP